LFTFFLFSNRTTPRKLNSHVLSPNIILAASNATDNEWLAKLRAKLSSSLTSTSTSSLSTSTIQKLLQEQTIQEPRYEKYPLKIKAPEDIYKWNYVLTEKYRQGIAQIDFKCPREGLFSNPINCGQFLQCVYFGTVHERFYVLNCPAGLHFNQALEQCDYPQNVNCVVA
jgi:hypothetical protein